VVTARTPIVVLAAIAYLGHAAAHAQPANEEAEREYRLGYQALRSGDCVEALAHYQRSLELSPRPRTLFNMAACQEDLGLPAEAWRSYHAFLDLAEGRDAKIAVKARARISALRAVLRGKVTVTSAPPGAAVLVDGERQQRGVTPLTLALEPGLHTIRVATPDAIAVERAVDLAPDALERVDVTLELSSEIRIEVDPDDAVIELDAGGATAVGRLAVKVAPGEHVIAIRRDGYLPEQVAIDAVAGGSHVERMRLRRAASTASLVIAGVPTAAISVDGIAARSSPTSSGARTMRGLTAGAHEIVVAAGPRLSWRETVHLSPDEVVTVAFDDPSSSTTRRRLGWSLGGVGVVGLAGASTLGVLALRDVASPMPDDHDRGKRRALLADGLFITSTVAVVVAWRLLRKRAAGVTISRRLERAR
jgi:hypothetical protein